MMCIEFWIFNKSSFELLVPFLNSLTRNAAPAEKSPKMFQAQNTFAKGRTVPLLPMLAQSVSNLEVFQIQNIFQNFSG